MNSLDYMMLILGMTLVTYIPRALPAALVGRCPARATIAPTRPP